MANNDQEFLIQQIRTQYTEAEHTEFDKLKALDIKVNRPAHVFAYTYGTVSALVMGSGMSLIMTDIGAILGLQETLVPGIITGVVGMVMALTTYPIYKKILSRRKKKYGPAILALSEKLMENK